MYEQLHGNICDKSYTFFSNRQMEGVNPLKKEVDFQMGGTNTDLHAVWEKSLLHC